MKNSLSFILAFGLSIVSPMTYSEQITDNYINGDTLTATTMDNIKAAVNSKQDRVSGICAPGTAIGSINADGTVTCETDDDSGGDITDINAGAGLSGGGTAGAVTLSLTGSVSISGHSFHDIDSGRGDCFIFHEPSGASFFEPGSGNSCVAVSGIQIPDGVSLTSFDCLVFDNDSTSGVGIENIQMRRTNLQTGNTELIFETSSTVNSTSVQMLSDPTPTSPAINNGQFSYFINVNHDGISTGNVRFYGCTLSY